MARYLTNPEAQDVRQSIEICAERTWLGHLSSVSVSGTWPFDGLPEKNPYFFWLCSLKSSCTSGPAETCSTKPPEMRLKDSRPIL